MYAEPPSDFVGREEFLVGGIVVCTRLRHCHCGSCVECFMSVTCSM